MTYKKLTSLFVLALAISSTSPVMATAIVPSSQAQSPSYDECSQSCSDFSQVKECQEFRRANQICTKKKNDVWPHYSAAVLEELEC